jgi:hypothetical protein
MNARDYISRPPRHEPQANTQSRLAIKSADARESVIAELVDLSRQGLKAVCDHQFRNGASVGVEIQLPTTSMQLSPSAKIRWCRIQEDGRWAVGLLFDQELSWEAMGELFLNGVLASESTSSST